MKHRFTSILFGSLISALSLNAQTALRPVKYVMIRAGFEVDSQRYTYSGGRGGNVPYVNMWPEYRMFGFLYSCGQFDQIDLDFDTAEVFNLPTPRFLYTYRYANSYDVHSRLTGQLTDTGNSLTHELLTTISGIGTSASTRQTDIWDSSTSSWLPFARTITSYNSVGKITDAFNQSYSGGSWVNKYHETYAYNTQHKLTAYGERVFQPGLSGLDSVSNLLYYGAAGDLDSILSLGRQTSGMQAFWNTSRFRFFYNSTHDPVIVESRAGRNLDFRDSSVYDSQHRRIYVYQTWDSMGKQVPVAEINISYFGNQVHEIKTKALSDPSFRNYVSDSYERYDYEEYIPTSVAAPGTISRCNVYPIPANNSINIEAAFSKATTVHCEIVDMAGRRVQLWEVPLSDHFKTSVPVSDLSAGNYLLRINGNGESYAKRFVIAR